MHRNLWLNLQSKLKDLIEEIQELYNWFVKFITKDIWSLNIDDFGNAKKKFIKYLRVAIITIKGNITHNNIPNLDEIVLYTNDNIFALYTTFPYNCFSIWII